MGCVCSLLYTVRTLILKTNDPQPELLVPMHTEYDFVNCAEASGDVKQSDRCDVMVMGTVMISCSY